MWVGAVDQEPPAVLTDGVLMPIACHDDLGYAGAEERMRVTASNPTALSIDAAMRVRGEPDAVAVAEGENAAVLVLSRQRNPRGQRNGEWAGH